MKKRKIKNFRDLNYIKSKNNIRIKRHLIIRSGFLYNLRDKDISYLNSLNIDKVIDLRSSEEVKDCPDSKINSKMVIAEYENHALNLKSDGINRAGAKYYIDNRRCDESVKTREKDFYSIIYTKKIYNNEGIKEIFNSLKNHESILFHCRGGKDRTGVSSLLILLSLGFTKEEAIKDYLKTNNNILVFLIKLGLTILGFNKYGKDVLDYNTFARKDLIEQTFIEIESNYKNIEEFLLKEYNITKEDLLDIKKYYLE